MDSATMNWNDADAADSVHSGGRVRVIEENAGQDERQWATFLHLSGLGGFILPVVGSIVPPLVMWLMKRERSAFIDDHGREAVNFQISIVVYFIMAGILTMVCIGFPLLIALPFLQIIASIVMAVRANGGEYVRYPVTIRFLS